MPGATENFDGCCDAWKLFSPNGNAPNIFTKTPIEDELAINTLPPLSTSFATGLLLRIGVSGDYSFKSSEPESFDAGVCIMMFDQVTGNIYNLRDTAAINTISLPVISKDDEARFILIFSLSASVHSTQPTCMNCRDGEASIKKAGWSNWQYFIKDSAGIVFDSGTALTDSVEIKGYYPGLYVAVIESQFFTCSDSISFRVPQRKTVQRPSTASGHQLNCGHIHLIHIRALLAIHFDADKMLVHDFSHRIIFKRFVLHHMAPVASGVANTYQY